MKLWRKFFKTALFILTCFLLSSCYKYTTDEGYKIISQVSAIDIPDEKIDLTKGYNYFPSYEFGKYLDPEELLPLIINRNPSLAEYKYRIQGLLKKASSAGKLPDFKVMCEMNRLPATEPWRFDNIEFYMFSISRELLFPSKLKAMSDVYIKEAYVEFEKYNQIKSELTLQLMYSFFDYFIFFKEKEILESVRKITEELIKVAKFRYESGLGEQQEILLFQSEFEILNKEIIEADKKIEIAKIEINTLIVQKPDSFLPVPEVQKFKPVFKNEDVVSLMLKHRPEIKIKNAEILMSEAMLNAVEKEAVLPDLMVRGGYELSPQMGDGFNASIGINLPWFNSKRDDEIKEAKKKILTAKAMYEKEVLESTGEIKRIIVSIRAIEKQIEKFELLIPIARENFLVTRLNYEQNRTDYLKMMESLKIYYDVQKEYYILTGMLGKELAVLQRYSGVPIKNLIIN